MVGMTFHKMENKNASLDEVKAPAAEHHDKKDEWVIIKTPSYSPPIEGGIVKKAQSRVIHRKFSIFANDKTTGEASPSSFEKKRENAHTTSADTTNGLYGQSVPPRSLGTDIHLPPQRPPCVAPSPILH